MSTDVHRLGGYGILAIPTLPNSVYSVNSVGEQRTITICVNPCHPWEKRYSRRTHARNLLVEKSLPQMSTDVHRLGGYGIPAIPTLPNSVYSVNSVGEQRTSTICVHLCHPWEKSIPAERTEHTEPSGREEPPTDEHGCSQIRRVWHPCHTHAARFSVFCEFCGRTAHHNHLCQSVPSVGEKIFPQNAHTEPSGREESPTDEHGCSQIRRVWHPCHTHAAKFCILNSVGEQRTITICVHPCHPWESFLCKKVLCVPCHPWEE